MVYRVLGLQGLSGLGLASGGFWALGLVGVFFFLFFFFFFFLACFCFRAVGLEVVSGCMGFCFACQGFLGLWVYGVSAFHLFKGVCGFMALGFRILRVI